MRGPRDESWRARAPDRKGSIQAPAVGITAPGVDRVVADEAQAYCPRAEGLGPWGLSNSCCPDTYELLKYGSCLQCFRSTIELCELFERRERFGRGRSW